MKMHIGIRTETCFHDIAPPVSRMKLQQTKTHTGHSMPVFKVHISPTFISSSSTYSFHPGTADSTIPSPLPPKRKLVQPHFIHTPSPIYNPLQPPSPEDLSRRLEKLSSRSDSPPLVDDITTSSSASDVINPSPRAPVSGASISTHQFIVVDESEHIHPSNAPFVDDILKQNIQGLYRLWKTIRPQAQQEDRRTFLRIAREALANL